MNNWQAITTFLFLVGFFLYNLITGKALLTFLRVKSNKVLSFSTGLMIVFAVTEIVSLPFMILQGPFQPLFITLCSIICFIFVISAHYLFVQKKDFSVFKIDYLNLINPYFYILAGLVILLTVIPACFANFDGDDAFYISISTSIQATGKIFANNPSIGLDKFPFPANYQFTSYEILIAVLSEVLGFRPVTVNHTIMPLIIIPSAFISLLALAKALFEGKKGLKEQYIFVIVLALLTLFSGFSGYLGSAFLILRTWMGKTIMVNLCFPTFTSYFIYAIKGETNEVNQTGLITPNSPYFFLITISLLAATCLTAVGLYLLPVYYFVLFLAVVLYPDKKYGLKVRLNLSVKAFISVIPIICLMLYYYYFMQQSGFLTILHEFDNNLNWWTEGNRILNGNMGIIALYFVSYFYFLIFGKGMDRIIFAYTPIVLLITFLNPLLYDFVGTYLTSKPVYWRLFWLVPSFWTISAYLTESLKMLNNLKLKWLLLIPLFIICNPESLVLTDSRFQAPQNAGKIPSYIGEDVNFILDRVNTDNPNDLYLLSLPKYNIYMRQYTGNIALVMPRINYVKEAYQIIGEEDQFPKVMSLFETDANGVIIGYPKTFNVQTLKDLNITLIITPDIRRELLADYVQFSLNDGDFLYIHHDILKNSG